MDASRYLLLNIGGGPRMVILDDEAPGLLDGIEVLRDQGTFALRPDDHEEVFSSRMAEREVPVDTTQRSPFG